MRVRTVRQGVDLRINDTSRIRALDEVSRLARRVVSDVVLDRGARALASIHPF